MAKLTRDDVLRLARLAHIELNETEANDFGLEMDAILEYVEQLKKVDVTGLDPTSQVTGLTNVMRPDKIRSYGYEPKELLKNLPASQDDLIKVRRVL